MKNVSKGLLWVAVVVGFFTLGASCGSSDTSGVTHCCSGGLYYACSAATNICPEGCQVDETKTSMCN
jgi:hypothetical protein